MKRRIIKQGHSTLTVTLPARWVKQLDLKGGDELEVIERDGMLALHTDKRPQHPQITIDLTGLSVQMIWKHFASAYRQGYDEVKVVYDTRHKNYENAYSYFTHHFPHTRLGQKLPDKPILDTIQDVVNRFIGWGIIDASEDGCTIRELSEDSGREFESSLRRIFLLLLQMFERAGENIEHTKLNDVSKYNDMHVMDTNVDRFHDFCCRIINKVGYPVPSKKPLIITTLYLLEILGDELKHIAIHCARAKKEASVVAPLARKVEEQFRLYYQLFYKFDRAVLSKISENDQYIYSEHFKLARKGATTHEERGILSHLKQISKKIMALTELRIEIEMCR